MHRFFTMHMLGPVLAVLHVLTHLIFIIVLEHLLCGGGTIITIIWQVRKWGHRESHNKDGLLASPTLEPSSKILALNHMPSFFSQRLSPTQSKGPESKALWVMQHDLCISTKACLGLCTSFFFPLRPDFQSSVCWSFLAHSI